MRGAETVSLDESEATILRLDGSGLRSLPPPPPASVRYERLSLLGSGGAATVHLGRATHASGASRDVAIKSLHPHLAGRTDDARELLEEARIGLRLSHPNVCTVHDVAVVDGAWSIVMEHVAGLSLAALAARAATRPDLACTAAWATGVAWLFAEAAEGFHAAHELTDAQGRSLEIVHRDATPQNVMVSWSGAVKVVDFGITLSAGRVPRTQPGFLRGKVGYVSPEQLSGRPLTRRSDVWSLGVGLWEMITMQRLFARRSDAETFDAIARAPIPTPSSVAPWVPPALDAIVMGALCRDPAARTPTALALADALRGFVGASGLLVTRARMATMVSAFFAERPAASADRRRSSLPVTIVAIGRPSPFAEPSAASSVSERLATWGRAAVRTTREALDETEVWCRELWATHGRDLLGDASTRTLVLGLAAIVALVALSAGARAALRSTRHHAHAPLTVVVASRSVEAP